ncbi:MAG: gliding motility-associated C-terminal domain-containing protein [Ferruginibacter sp.]
MRLTKNTLLYIFLLLMCTGTQQSVFAQCTAPINTFPYNESFEDSDNGNWTSIPANIWECGTPGPGKQVIVTPGGGLKSWVVGGLNSSHYSNGNSELRSPCFDFSSLVNPQISFKVFWETELRFDGCTFQYSLDGANTWTTLGSTNSNSSCQGTNWFTYGPIYPYLNSEPGWSGNIQTSGGDNGGPGTCLYGLGSGGWVTAQHNMQMLAGESSVIFRFYFGAGNQCNYFDGFAVDDVHIDETPPAATPDFTYTCGTNNTAQFTNNTQPCQVAWNWNFGDPASGSNNISAAENPSHVFSTAGTYSVSLTVTYGTGTQVTIPPKTITVLGVTTTSTNIACNGDQNGSITVNVNPAGVYNYSWDTNPPQNTPVINNLSGGITYTVTVTATNACSVSVPVILTEPALLIANPVVTPAKCGHDNGTIAANVTGGTPPYVYTWSNSQSTSIINNLAAGAYDLAVTDQNGCIALPINNIQVLAIVNPINAFLGNDTTICPGQKLLLSPGLFAGYKWQDNSTAQTFSVTKTGTYAVVVTDADGCTGTDTINVTVDCKGIYFPTAFTPNNDLLNPAFGPIGDLGSLEHYDFKIYNRYSELVFSSTDPYKKWDGTFKALRVNAGGYVWIATYNVRGQRPVSKKGTILLLR